jgi:DNA-binding transcriptional MocR family regulator
MNDLVICYGDHVGHPRLRQEILTGEAPNLNIEDVLVTAGAASALFMVSTSLLEAADEMG